jgi:hypothetical protein
MYARITFSKFLVKTLRYHDQKIEKGVAEFLYAGNFLKDKELLTEQDKLFHFQRLSTLNQSVRRTVLQVSLNFHPTDHLSNDKMQSVALSYLRQMRLDHQPFLIYRHRDTPHPHLHVVSTTVQSGGVRLNIDRKDIYQSSSITRQIEFEYQLVPAGSNRPNGQQLKVSYHPEKVTFHGKPLLPAMSKVLDEVVPKYKYTTLSELNAVLRPYNLVADRGNETTRIFEHGGLVYRPINSEGKGLNTYIKASALASKPTLKNLERRFAANVTLREADRTRVTTAIDWALFKKSLDFDALGQALERGGISMVYKKDPSGVLKDIWYVDYETKAVFDGKALGERYTAQAIAARCVTKALYEEQQVAERLRVNQRISSGLL